MLKFKILKIKTLEFIFHPRRISLGMKKFKNSKIILY